MNDHAKFLYSIGFRMDRRDFVALSTLLARRNPWHTLLALVVYFGSLVGIAALARGPHNLLPTMASVLAFPGVALWLPLVLVGPALLVFAPRIAGLLAALAYRRSGTADRDVTLHLTAEGIEGGSPDLYSRIGWGAVHRLVETRTHLLIQISHREALIIPRRAVPNEDQYNNLKGFIRARTGLGTIAA